MASTPPFALKARTIIPGRANITGTRYREVWSRDYDSIWKIKSVEINSCVGKREVGGQRPVGLWASKIGQLGALIACTTHRKVGRSIRRRGRRRETIGGSRLPLLQTTKPLTQTRLGTILGWPWLAWHYPPLSQSFCLRSPYLFPHRLSTNPKASEPAGASAAVLYAKGGHDLWLVGFTRLHVRCIVTRSNIMLYGNNDVPYIPILVRVCFQCFCLLMMIYF